MASNAEQGKQLCSICVGKFKDPRKLPGCTHSFCANCLLEYIANLRKENSLLLEFDCPVCRKPSKLPENAKVTAEWVQSLEHDTELLAGDTTDGQQNDDSMVCCSQCKYLDKGSVAKLYCLNCKDSFCEACSELLHSFKQNKDHVLLPTEDSSKNFHYEAVKLLRKMLTCSSHNAPVEQWCQDDDMLCCVYCVTEKHRLCSTVRNITDFPDEKVVLQTSSKDMLKMCKKIADHLQAISDVIKDHDSDLKDQEDEVESSLYFIKSTIIDLLDTLEQNIQQQCKAITKDIKMKNENERQELHNIARKNSVFTYLLENIFGKLSPECKIICTQEITNMLFNLERSIVERGKSRLTESVELKTECLLDELLNNRPTTDTSQLAVVERTEENVPLPEFMETYSVRLDTVAKAGFAKINASLNTYPAFMNMTYLPNDYLILCDTFNGICCLVDENSELVASHNFNVKTVKRGDTVHTNFIHATPMKTGLIAVSLPLMYKICFLTADPDLKLTCEMSCDKTPHAIQALTNNELAVMWSNPPAFGIIKIETGSYTESVYFTHDKSGRILKSSFRMAIDEDRKHVIQPCLIDNAVYCFDFDGNPVFKYIHDRLQCPAGVAIDKQGEIYICERTLGLIHVLSPAGKLLQLVSDICPANPFAIAFSRRGDRFVVSTLKAFDRVYFFSLEMEGDDTINDDDQGQISDADMDYYDDVADNDVDDKDDAAENTETNEDGVSDGN